jgi:hypothetical protein
MLWALTECEWLVRRRVLIEASYSIELLDLRHVLICSGSELEIAPRRCQLLPLRILRVLKPCLGPLRKSRFWLFQFFPIRSRRLRQKLFQEQLFAKKAATSTDVWVSAPPTGV